MVAKLILLSTKPSVSIYIYCHGNYTASSIQSTQNWVSTCWYHFQHASFIQSFLSWPVQQILQPSSRINNTIFCWVNTPGMSAAIEPLTLSNFHKIHNLNFYLSFKPWKFQSDTLVLAESMANESRKFWDAFIWEGTFLQQNTVLVCSSKRTLEKIM